MTVDHVIGRGLLKKGRIRLSLNTITAAWKALGHVDMTEHVEAFRSGLEFLVVQLGSRLEDGRLVEGGPVSKCVHLAASFLPPGAVMASKWIDDAGRTLGQVELRFVDGRYQVIAYEAVREQASA